MTKRYLEIQASIFQFPLSPHQMWMFRHFCPNLSYMSPAASKCISSLKCDFLGSPLRVLDSENWEHFTVITNSTFSFFSKGWCLISMHKVKQAASQPFPAAIPRKCWGKGVLLCCKNRYRALSQQELLILCFSQHLDLHTNHKTKW